ncbi:hypothetical protein FOZ62_032310, partial [Perkinsus olseni]
MAMQSGARKRPRTVGGQREVDDSTTERLDQLETQMSRLQIDDSTTGRLNNLETKISELMERMSRLEDGVSAISEKTYWLSSNNGQIHSRYDKCLVEYAESFLHVLTSDDLEFSEKYGIYWEERRPTGKRISLNMNGEELVKVWYGNMADGGEIVKPSEEIRRILFDIIPFAHLLPRIREELANGMDQRRCERLIKYIESHSPTRDYDDR